MQIVVTCDSYEELIAAAKQILEGRIAEGSPRKADPEQDAKPAPKKEKAPKKLEPDPEPAAEAEAKGEAKDGADVTESDVKVLLAEKIKSGKKAEVRELFAEYGVAKLSELMAKCPDKLAELAKKAEAL